MKTRLNICTTAIITLLLSGATSFSQDTPDPNTIYSQLINSYFSDIQDMDDIYTSLVVNDQTTNPDLTDMHIDYLPPELAGTPSTSEWQAFLKTASFAGRPTIRLTRQISPNVRIHFLSHVKKISKKPYSRRYRHMFGTLFFSPVLFSEDGRKALCILKSWQGREAASATLYLFEKRENTWVKVHARMLWIA